MGITKEILKSRQDSKIIDLYLNIFHNDELF